MSTSMTVTELTIYPVKSCAGIRLERSHVDSMGLQYDRRWMVVSPEGKFISQRTVPQMALIKTALNAGELTLSMAGKSDHTVPIVDANADKMDVVVWKDTLQVARVGAATDAWLSEALDMPCHLVYIADDVIRQCDLNFAKEGDRTGFADGFPLLLISEESLSDLNARLESPVDMRRFRPNIVIAGVEPYAEDEFTQFQIGAITMKAVKLCSRCPMPMVDPDVGERTSQEPIATLSTYRKWDGKIFFGMNVIQQQQGEIAVGDALTLESA